MKNEQKYFQFQSWLVVINICLQMESVLTTSERVDQSKEKLVHID